MSDTSPEAPVDEPAPVEPAVEDEEVAGWGPDDFLEYPEPDAEPDAEPDPRSVEGEPEPFEPAAPEGPFLTCLHCNNLVRKQGDGYVPAPCPGTDNGEHEVM